MGEGASKPKEQDLMDMSMEMKMAAKQMKKEAMREEAKEKLEKKKVAEAISKGKKEIAQIYAENAIRNHKQAVSLHRLGAQMEAVDSRLMQAYRTQNITATMQRCLPGLQSALGNIEKIGLSGSMEQFNKVFEDLGVQSEVMAGTLDSATGSTVDSSEVDKLIEQVQNEQGIEEKGKMATASSHKIPTKVKEAKKVEEDVDDIEKRLAMLKQQQKRCIQLHKYSL
eukprot:TRINITY_DN887_c0_g1_i1.p2 TRINITY_DN887_c0_g1~~TRINITY_DN887_c0_g1_i1.p2  ORF type:complete len:225 (+),score=70.11 TRINITY_DN887_c0_g1_i1:136-810(+)